MEAARKIRTGNHQRRTHRRAVGAARIRTLDGSESELSVTSMAESAEPPSDGGGGSGRWTRAVDSPTPHAYCFSNGVIREAGENPARPPPL